MFLSKLRSAWEANNSMVCVGLDPDLARLPAPYTGSVEGIFEFNRAIIDATADLVCAYKPQIAFYSAVRAEDQLKRTIEYIHKKYPGILVILDSKRGDIGSTAEMYAIEAFGRYGVDAVTVNPYLGGDSLKPFLDHRDKGVIILCRTSNAGAADLQTDIYLKVASLASNEWNSAGNIALVMGATYPDDLTRVRAIVGDMPFLVPGVGAQGGSIEDVVKRGQDSTGAGLIVNSSRSIIYASAGADFAKAARKATLTLKEQINSYRASTAT